LNDAPRRAPSLHARAHLHPRTRRKVVLVLRRRAAQRTRRSHASRPQRTKPAQNAGQVKAVLLRSATPQVHRRAARSQDVAANGTRHNFRLRVYARVLARVA
jgi:hypothetical protein